MSIRLTTANKQTILIHDTPITSGEGGEGSVHRIISPAWYNTDCVKLYFEKNRTRSRERKLDFMMKHPPSNLVKLGGCAICWPKELVYQGNRLAGFVMPLAFSGSISLAELCNPGMEKMAPIWRQKYERSSPLGIESRLKLCVNIAAAVNLIHLENKYVLVDLKPQNLLVTSDGKVSVIDIDSIQIAENGKVVFPAQFATPEYVPAEGNRINPSKDFIPESWDCFSMAVMFYQILFGLHPYAASFKGAYKDSTSISDSIKNGLFVFGARKSYVHVRPRLHENFGCIPASLQDLFMKAFDAGYLNPGQRPRPELWGRMIFGEIQKPVHRWRGMDTVIPPRRVKKPAASPAPVPPPMPSAPKKQATVTAPSPKPSSSHSSNGGRLLSILLAGFLLVVALAVCGRLGVTCGRQLQRSSFERLGVDQGLDCTTSRFRLPNAIPANRPLRPTAWYALDSST